VVSEKNAPHTPSSLRAAFERRGNPAAERKVTTRGNAHWIATAFGLAMTAGAGVTSE